METRNQIRVKTVCFNRWKQNCHLIVGSEHQQCVVVDPGFDEMEIVHALEAEAIPVVAILLTHGHFDHVASAKAIGDRFGNPPIFMHPSDQEVLRSANTFTHFLKESRIELPDSIHELHSGKTLPFLGDSIEIINTPGHTPGSCVFALPEGIFSGDALLKNPNRMRGLPGRDLIALMDSIRAICHRFEGETIVYPGHGLPTTISSVRAHFQC